MLILRGRIATGIECSFNCSSKYSELASVTSLCLSGSVAEGCRLRTEADFNNDEYEIDLAVAADLDVQ